MERSYILQEAKDYLLITVGVTLYAFGVTVFMLPYGLTTGGVAGISAIIYYVTGVEVQVTYIGINLCFLLVAVKVLGLRFCLKTIYGVLTMTLVLWLWQRLVEVPDPVTGIMSLPRLMGDEAYFMACVLGAIINGIGLAFCFENNGSTGGTDIIAAIVNKYRPVSLGSVIMACDVVIISSCYFVFHDWFRVIYGFVMLFVCSMTLDYIMRRQHHCVQFMIFSRNPGAIADAILRTKHGVTMLDGEGWYTHTDRKVVVSIIRERDKVSMQRLIKSIDPYAFVSMSDATGVWGHGFDQMKVKVSKGVKDKRTLVFATHSSHKLEEVRKAMGEDYEIRSLEEIGCNIDIPERAGSLAGNALFKARFVKRYYGFDCIADDTALECEGLGGLPGVHSRNYSSYSDSRQPQGEALIMEGYSDEVSQELLNTLHIHAPVHNKPIDYDSARNVQRLLVDLQGKPRRAMIHTVIAYITGDYDNPEKCHTETFDGVLEGHVADEPSCPLEETVFYDSVFVPKGFGCTYHELSPETREGISQRVKAIGKLKQYLDRKQGD